MSQSELREVYAWYGQASYYATCFEVELIILLVTAARVKKPGSSSAEIYLLDRQQLVRELKGMCVTLHEADVRAREISAALGDAIGFSRAEIEEEAARLAGELTEN